MPSEFSKKILVFVMLGLLTASAFFMRLENFKNSQKRSIDEIVYYRMGRQILEEGPSGYNTIPYGQEMAATGRPLPEYFSRPLFKHPPLLSLFIALSLKVFGATLISGGFVPIFFGVMAIPVVYLLGSLVYDRRVGFLAALLLWMDPISIICSQKIWLGTTIAFFSVLSIYLFTLGLKQNKDRYYLYSGIASGLAASTKYPGILVSVAIFLFAVFYSRPLFRNKKFLISLFMPFVVISPWLFWNYKVYGHNILQVQGSLHHGVGQLIHRLSNPNVLILAGFSLIVLLLIYFLLRKNGSDGLPKEMKVKTYPLNISVLIFIGLLISIFPQILNAIKPFYLPTHSWRGGFFHQELPVFYFGRLVEFSPIYLFSFAALLNLVYEEEFEAAVLRLSATIILAFFIIWGNYQSRYILAALPFLIILASGFLIHLFDRTGAIHQVVKRIMVRAVFLIGFIIILQKIYFVNIHLSFPHDFCYF